MRELINNISIFSLILFWGIVFFLFLSNLFQLIILFILKRIKKTMHDLILLKKDCNNLIASFSNTTCNDEIQSEKCNTCVKYKETTNIMKRYNRLENQIKYMNHVVFVINYIFNTPIGRILSYLGNMEKPVIHLKEIHIKQ